MSKEKFRGRANDKQNGGAFKVVGVPDDTNEGKTPTEDEKKLICAKLITNVKGKTETCNLLIDWDTWKVLTEAMKNQATCPDKVYEAIMEESEVVSLQNDVDYLLTGFTRKAGHGVMNFKMERGEGRLRSIIVAESFALAALCGDLLIKILRKGLKVELGVTAVNGQKVPPSIEIVKPEECDICFISIAKSQPTLATNPVIGPVS